MSFQQVFNDMDRVRHIVSVLFKYELGFLVDRLGLKSYLTFGERFRRATFRQEVVMKPYEFAALLEELGGAFVKLGQLLSLRPDFIPREYAEELNRLQDSMKGFEFSIVQRVLEQEYGKKLSEVFLKIESKPVAAASIGQVHKAWLRNGKKVAVKVKRPHIEQVFQADIDLLKRLARILQHHYPGLQGYDINGILKEFERYTADELDYLVEAKHIDVFYRNFLSNPAVKIPKVYFEHTTKNVLVMEYVDGVKLQDATGSYDPKIVARNFMDALVEQVLVRGYFHADPHPGNVLLLPDNKIAFLDFGIVGKIQAELKERVENVFIALTLGDRDKLADAFMEIGFVDANVNKEKLKEDLSLELGRFYDVAVKDIDMKSFGYHVLHLARMYKMQFPANFVLLMKAMMTAEGMCKRIEPGFQYIGAWKERTRKIQEQRMSFDYSLQQLKGRWYDVKRLVDDFPAGFRKLLKGRESHTIEFDDASVKKLTYYLDNAITRIALGVIIAALVIGAAFVAALSDKQGVLGVPVLALVYLLLAIMLSMMLMNSIRKEKGGV